MTLLNAILQNDTVKVLVLDNQKTAFEYIKEPNTIIAILAIIVSLLGLWISANYSRQTLEHTIKHSKLSVEPLLRFFVRNESKKNKITIELQNCGFGTASITNLTVNYKNKTYRNFKELISENLISEDESNSEIEIYTYYFDKDSFISSNDKVKICSFEAIFIEDLELFKKILLDTKATVKYETMYLEKRTLQEDNFWSKKSID